MEQSYKKKNALVLLSGGQDSTTSLFWAKKNFNKIFAISFYYKQRHSLELKYAEKITSKLNIEHKILDISILGDLVISDLFKNKGPIKEKSHPLNRSVPSSFVPYRNLLFLVLASAWASSKRIRHIIIGVCETDFSGYADCRDVFIKSAQTTLNLATDFKESNIIIHTPIMWLTKAETFKMAEELDCLSFILKQTITCYEASEKINPFGMGCGKCPACKLRKQGYEEYLEKYK